VVLVHLQVALGVYGQINAGVFADLFQHVVEEAQPCLNIGASVAVKVDFDMDGCFMGRTVNCSLSTATKEES